MFNAVGLQPVFQVFWENWGLHILSVCSAMWLCSMVLYGALQCCRVWYEVVYEAVLQWDVMWYAVWCNLYDMMQCKCNCIVSCHNKLANFYKTLLRLHATAGNHTTLTLSYSLPQAIQTPLIKKLLTLRATEVPFKV
jgi:hypothetical protein